MRVGVKWIAVGMGVMVLLNLAMASVHVASTGISAHQLRTDWFYLGLAVLGLAGMLPGLWRQEWQPCGRLWWIVAAVTALAMAGGLLYVHAWSGGSFAHYDHGLPFPWIKGAAMIEGFVPPDTGPVHWNVAPRGLLADLLIWGSVGYTLAALVARLHSRSSAH
jgi:hypothetical protein